MDFNPLLTAWRSPLLYWFSILSWYFNPGLLISSLTSLQTAFYSRGPPLVFSHWTVAGWSDYSVIHIQKVNFPKPASTVAEQNHMPSLWVMSAISSAAAEALAHGWMYTNVWVVVQIHKADKRGGKRLSVILHLWYTSSLWSLWFYSTSDRRRNTCLLLDFSMGFQTQLWSGQSLCLIRRATPLWSQRDKCLLLPV